MRTLKFAFRSLKRQVLITIINLTGLSLGIACSLLIGLYILDELAYDKFHAKADDIYRITTHFSSGGNESSYSNSATPIAPFLPQDAPEVLTAARVYEREAAIQVIPASGSPTPDAKFREPHFVFADSTIFNVFSFDFIAGNAISSFPHINSVIITKRAAERYFGSVDVLGRQLLFEERLTLEITGVVNEWPEQSHLTFDMMAPFDNFFRLEDEGTANYLKTDWVYTPVSTYALLQPGASPAIVEEKLKGMVTKYGNEHAQGRVAHVLQPLTSIRLYSTFSGDSSSGRITELYVFGFVGLLTLLVACFNFINLSIVASLKRAKEAGIRKTLGAGKATLALQFLTESALTAGIGSLIGLLLAAYGITILNQLTEKHLAMTDLLRPDVAMLLVALLVFVVLIACTYPSIAFSATNPINSMRGTAMHGGPSGRWLRKSLVIAQLGISILLFSATLVVYNQMKFIKESPLGFQKEHMLLVPLFSSHINNVLGSGVDGVLRQRMNTFEDALAKNPAVEASTLSSALPGQGAISALVTTDDIRPEDNVFFPAVAVDYDYLQAYDMELLAGRHFSREFGTDHLAAFIINEEALKVLGWQTPENAIGKNFAAMGKEGKVVGVIKNYHFQGLREVIQPLFLEVAASKFTTFTIRLKNSDIPASIAFVEEQWNGIFPEKVFEFRFLDDQLDLIYQGEERLATLVTWFAGLSFLISSIGLFGIASFLHLRRTKEIGIRKVLGARMLQLFVTLSKEFFHLTVAAIAIMGPVSYFVMAEWLNGFAYRTSLGLMPFLLSALVCGLVVFVTIAFQTYRSSRLDPVKALKYE